MNDFVVQHSQVHIKSIQDESKYGHLLGHVEPPIEKQENLNAYLKKNFSLSQVFPQLNYAFISMHFLQVLNVIAEASFLYRRD